MTPTPSTTTSSGSAICVQNVDHTLKYAMLRRHKNINSPETPGSVSKFRDGHGSPRAETKRMDCAAASNQLAMQHAHHAWPRPPDASSCYSCNPCACRLACKRSNSGTPRPLPLLSSTHRHHHRSLTGSHHRHARRWPRNAPALRSGMPGAIAPTPSPGASVLTWGAESWDRAAAIRVRVSPGQCR